MVFIYPKRNYNVLAFSSLFVNDKPELLNRTRPVPHGVSHGPSAVTYSLFMPDWWTETIYPSEKDPPCFPAPHAFTCPATPRGHFPLPSMRFHTLKSPCKSFWAGRPQKHGIGGLAVYARHWRPAIYPTCRVAESRTAAISTADVPRSGRLAPNVVLVSRR
jgi:hypothetical protein